MQSSSRILLPLYIIFCFFLLLPFLMPDLLANNYIDRNVLLAANIILFVISLMSFFIQKKGLSNKNPNVFVRSVMAGMMIKMIFCVAAVIAYVYLSGKGFNKRAIICSLFLYLAYLAAEVMAVSKMNKQHHG